MRPPHPPSTRRKVLDLYVAGSTHQEIAKATGVSLRTIWVWIVDAGIPLRSRAHGNRWSEDERAAVVALYQAGVPIGDLAAHCGACKATVRRWAARAGCSRPRGGQRRYTDHELLEALTEAGSFKGAGRLLGCNEKTVAARLAKRREAAPSPTFDDAHAAGRDGF